MTTDNWYGRLLTDIRTQGNARAPRGRVIQELFNYSFSVGADNVIVSEARKPNYRFMVAEWLWMAFGRDSVEELARYNSQMRQFSDDGITLAGAYGPYFWEQTPYVVETLRSDPDSRQAFIKIGRVPQLKSKDVPCTLTWQFFTRPVFTCWDSRQVPLGDGRELVMVANMRSSDAWLGIPYDVYTFSQLGASIAALLGVHRGPLYMNLASAHLYAEDWEKADETRRFPIEYARSPELPGYPPMQLLEALKGNFVAWKPLAPAVWSWYAAALATKRSEDALGLLRQAYRSS